MKFNKDEFVKKFKKTVIKAFWLGTEKGMAELIKKAIILLFIH